MKYEVRIKFTAPTTLSPAAADAIAIAIRDMTESLLLDLQLTPVEWAVHPHNCGAIAAWVRKG